MGTTIGGGKAGTKPAASAQKARTRERGKDQEAATGIKAKQGGSSGFGGFLSRIRKRTFEDIEDVAVHVSDVVGIVSDFRKVPSRSCLMTVSLPAAYQLEAMDAMDASSMGFVMCRFYVVPRRPFMPDDEEQEA